MMVKALIPSARGTIISVGAAGAGAAGGIVVWAGAGAVWIVPIGAGAAWDFTVLTTASALVSVVWATDSASAGLAGAVSIRASASAMAVSSGRGVPVLQLASTH